MPMDITDVLLLPTIRVVAWGAWSHSNKEGVLNTKEWGKQGHFWGGEVQWRGYRLLLKIFSFQLFMDDGHDDGMTMG